MTQKNMKLLQKYDSEYRSPQGDFKLYSKKVRPEMDNENPNLFEALLYWLTGDDELIHRVVNFDRRELNTAMGVRISRVAGSAGHRPASHDEEQGYFAYRSINLNGFAHHYLAELRSNGWTLGEKAGTAGWFRYYRWPHLQGFYKYCCKEQMSPLEYVWLIAAAFITLCKDKYDTDGKLMAWLRFEVICNDPGERVMHIARAVWLWALEKRYKKLTNGTGLGAVAWIFRWYFKDQNHPINRLADKWSK